MYDNFYCYPAVVEKGAEELGVYFPDFDGCVSGGSDAKEAVSNAREALNLHLYGMEQDGDELPAPTSPENIRVKKNQYLIMVDVDYGIFRDKMDRKSVNRVVTLPRYLNAAAKEKGINVSQFLQEALQEHLGVR